MEPGAPGREHLPRPPAQAASRTPLRRHRGNHCLVRVLLPQETPQAFPGVSEGSQRVLSPDPRPFLPEGGSCLQT